MNKKFIVRLSDKERSSLPGDHQEAQRIFAEGPSCSDLAQGRCGWASLVGRKDRGGFRLSCANDRECSQTAGDRGFRTGSRAASKRADPPTPCKLDGEAEAKLIAMRLGKPPAGYGHWTLHLLADEMVALEIVDSISHETVRKVLKKTA